MDEIKDVIEEKGVEERRGRLGRTNGAIYGSMVALDNGAISSIMIWKSPALNVWISDMVYFVPLSRASVRMRVAATRLARSMQFLTVRALEKYGNSLRRSMNSTNLALQNNEK